MTRPSALRRVILILGHEARILVASPWLLGFAGLFAVLASGLVIFERSLPLDSHAVSRFGVTFGNLVVVLAALVSLVMSALSFSGDRSDGHEALLRSTGVSPGQFLLGKFLGLAITIIAALAVGLLIALVFSGPLLIIPSLAPVFLNGVILSLCGCAWGAVLGSWTGNRLSAIALALLAWFVAVFAFELVLWAAVPRLPAPWNVWVLAGGTALDPVEVVRLLALFLRGQGGAFGPAFLSAQAFFSSGPGLGLAIAIVLFHLGFPYLIAWTQVRKLP